MNNGPSVGGAEWTKSLLCDTLQLPMRLGRMEEVLERQKREVAFLFIHLFSVLFLINFGGTYYRGEGQIWRAWEMSGTGVYNVKFTKNQ